MSRPFRLAAVTRVREMTREQRQIDLAQAVQAAEILARQVSDLQNRRTEVERELREAGQAALNVDYLMSLRRYQTDIGGQMAQLDEQREQVEQEIERRRLKLADASRQVQVMERLRDQQAKAEQQQAAKREQATLDEYRRPTPG